MMGRFRVVAHRHRGFVTARRHYSLLLGHFARDRSSNKSFNQHTAEQINGVATKAHVMASLALTVTVIALLDGPLLIHPGYIY